MNQHNVHLKLRESYHCGTTWYLLIVFTVSLLELQCCCSARAYSILTKEVGKIHDLLSSCIHESFIYLYSNFYMPPPLYK